MTSIRKRTREAMRPQRGKYIPVWFETLFSQGIGFSGFRLPVSRAIAGMTNWDGVMACHAASHYRRRGHDINVAAIR